MSQDLKLAARGQWRLILPALGVNAQALVNKHGPCPICHGKDRFRFDDQNGDGGFICNQCGAGDGFNLAMRVTGKEYSQIAKSMEILLGLDQQYTRKPINQTEVDQYNAIRRAWEWGRTIADVSPVAKYLRARLGGACPRFKFLREHPSMFHPEDKGHHPAMLAKVVTHSDKAVNIHVTYLSRDGSKALVEPCRRVMPGKLPDGSAVRLMDAAHLMGVAEGIETAMSASLMFDIPVWACLNGNLLAKWIPPEIAEEIVVFGDNDLNFTGQAKAYHLANRLEVQLKRLVKVMIPTKAGQDWNDVYLASIEEKNRAGQV